MPNRLSNQGLATKVMAAGGAAIAAAVIWWYLFFEQMLGRHADEAAKCLIWTTDACSAGNMIGGLGDIPVYQPVLIWIGVAAMVAGLVLKRR